MKKNWSIVRNAVHGNGKYYLSAVVCTWLMAAVGFVSPLVLSYTVDSVIGTKPSSLPDFINNWIASLGGREFLIKNLWVCAAVIVGLTLLSSIFGFYRGKHTAVASESIARSLRDTLYDHLQNLKYSYHVKAETGDLIQRCTSDVETLRRFLSGQIVELGRIIFMLVFSISIMVSMDIRMTLVTLASFPVLVATSALYFRNIHKKFMEADEAEGKMSTTLQENLAGVRVVRAFGREQFEVDKFEAKNSAYATLAYKVSKSMSWFWGFSDGLSFLQTAAVLCVGIIFCVDGSMSLGQLMVFISYVNMLVYPMRQLGRIIADMGRATVSLGRISEIINTPVDGEGENGIKPDLHGDIVFDHVSFIYDDGTQEVLHDINFTIKEGQTLAILGGTGSGKSTLVHLLQRLYDVTDGAIRINGTDIREIDKKYLRSNIGMVLQEPFLYSRTIKENIAIASRNARDEEIYDAARIASLHDVINEFENGYDTVVGERGVTLSGGQKQRVAIARMLMQDTPVLIFDDSLSAVDTKTDTQIRTALKERRKGATSIIIAHRITTLSEADNIIVLDGGRIVQQGTHDELCQQEGLYRRIWQIQSMAGEDFENEGGEEA